MKNQIIFFSRPPSIKYTTYFEFFNFCRIYLINLQNMGGLKTPCHPSFSPYFLSIISCPNDVMKSCYKLKDVSRRLADDARCFLTLPDFGNPSRIITDEQPKTKEPSIPGLQKPHLFKFKLNLYFL